MSDEASMVVVEAVTLWINVEELLARKLPLPAYDAVIEWDAVESEVVANVATPEPLREAVPRTVMPSENVTLPLGLPPAEVTVAVNVTD